MKKSALITVTLLVLLSLSACGGKKTTATSNTSKQPKISKQTEVADTSVSTEQTASIASSSEVIEQSGSTITSSQPNRDPQTIYNSILGQWHSTEEDSNGITWLAAFTETYATMGPTQGVGSVLNFKISALNWDEHNQSLLITNEAYDPDGNRSSSNDYTLTVHDIDLENFSQLSVSGTTFATTDFTYRRD